MLIDWTLRGASVFILALILYQLRWSRGGSAFHIWIGRMTMVVGGLLVVLVAIRGAGQETLSAMYIAHLGAGVPFFICLFATGFYGRKARITQYELHRRVHRLLAGFTAALLVLALFFGLCARMLH